MKPVIRRRGNGEPEDDRGRSQRDVPGTVLFGDELLPGSGIEPFHWELDVLDNWPHPIAARAFQSLAGDS